MRNAFRIGRIFGIDLRVDSSWLVIFALVIWSLASLFGTWHPDWSSLTSFGVAIVAALLFFMSVLFHELAHSLIASKVYKIPVRDITLFMFGGVSNIEREPSTPGAEFLIAVVGPISSIALGVAMLMAGAIVSGMTGVTDDGMVDPAETVARMGPFATLVTWLGPVNILVGIFNLIPGFPLDGGRILRSILWKLSGDLRSATRWAASVGQFVGWTFIVMGLFMAFGYNVPFFGRGLVGGIWLALIGLFLRNAAAQHAAGAVVAEALHGLRVRDLMRTRGAWVTAETFVRDLVDKWFLRHEDRSYPVFAGGHFVGIVCLEDVRRIDTAEWDQRTVHDVMTPLESLTVTHPDEDVFDALRKLGTAGVRQLPVMQNATLVGVLFEQDISRWLALAGEPHKEARPARSRLRPATQST